MSSIKHVIKLTEPLRLKNKQINHIDEDEVEVDVEVENENENENKYSKVCPICSLKFNSNDKRILLCETCKEGKSKKLKCQAKSKNDKKCDKYSVICLGEKYCIFHVKFFFKDKYEKEGKQMCSLFNTRGCINYVSDGYKRCDSCRSNDTKNVRHHTKNELSKNTPLKEIDGKTLKFCGHCKEYMDIISFIKINDGETSLKCSNCRDKDGEINRKRRKNDKFRDIMWQLNSKLGGYKASASKRDIKWLLDDEFAISLFKDNCHYCGIKSSKEKLNGIDRIDNKLYYIEDNCVSSCNMCNKMKGLLDYNNFFKICEHISTYTGLMNEGELNKGLFSFSKNGKYKDTAKKKQKRINTFNDYTYELTSKQEEDIRKNPCDYCGLVPDINEIGIDRINNSKGYNIHNVVSCCTTCNFVKSDFDVDDFLNQCKNIYIFKYNMRSDIEDDIDEDILEDIDEDIEDDIDENILDEDIEENILEDKELNAKYQNDFRKRQIEKIGKEKYREKQNKYYKKISQLERYDVEKIKKKIFTKEELNIGKNKIVLMLKSDNNYTIKKMAEETDLSVKQVRRILGTY